MFNVTIFSKDHPAQLELLLRSMKRFAPQLVEQEANILYKISDNDFSKGYDLVKAEHPEFSYVPETKPFKEHVIDLVDSNKKYTVFFVDDNVFKDHFSFETLEWSEFTTNTSVVCLSLRMYPGINYSYTNNAPSPQPTFINTRPFTWVWLGSSLEWNYCMSVDGHIFRTNDMVPYVRNSPYVAPNTFEGYMAGNPIMSRPKMMCYSESKVLNIPANKVQMENNNRRGNISTKFLNDNFLSGKRLSINNIVGYKNRAPHEDIPLVFE